MSDQQVVQRAFDAWSRGEALAPFAGRFDPDAPFRPVDGTALDSTAFDERWHGVPADSAR